MWFLTKWTGLSKSHLKKNQWPLWGTFKIHKLTFLKTKLNNNSFDICKTEWSAHFEFYFEPFKDYQESEVASFWNKVFKWTKATNLSCKRKCPLKPGVPCLGPIFPVPWTHPLLHSSLAPGPSRSFPWHMETQYVPFHSVGLKHGS